MSKPAESDWGEIRAKLEGLYTAHRINELELWPVQGNFNAAHLQEINRRIFQDMPGAGFKDVTPGQFRGPVPEHGDWMKQRELSTVSGAFFVAYSRMDDAAHARLGRVLEGAKPDDLKGLNTKDFTARMGQLYAELDYVHPFPDGNSRTLRTFTKQLAKEAGFDLQWERITASPVGRDLLYIARDISVNKLAMPEVRLPSTMQKITYTQDRIGQSRDMTDLLKDIIRPSRSVAFEHGVEAEALKKHPELAEAYATLRGAMAYRESQPLDKQVPFEQARQAVVKHIVSRLNTGEVSNFAKDFARDAGRNNAPPPPERER